MAEMTGTVVAVAASQFHAFSKTVRDEVRLIEGLGVVGDAHSGSTVKHRSRVRVDPSQPNLRQVHLIAVELLEELAGLGFDIAPGDLGENILVRGIDLIGLPRGTRLKFGSQTEIEVTGLRNPCRQIEDFRPGLLKHMIISHHGGISLNWRLILMPLAIVDYVVAHELAHLKEMNHSPRFWSAVGQLLPGFEAARDEIKGVDMSALPI